MKYSSPNLYKSLGWMFFVMLTLSVSAQVYSGADLMSGEFLLAISILLVICVFFFLFRFRFKIEIKDGVLYTRFFFKTNSINLDNVNEFIIINEGITELVHGNGVFKVYPIVKNHEKLMNELESVLGLKPKHIKK